MKIKEGEKRPIYEQECRRHRTQRLFSMESWMEGQGRRPTNTYHISFLFHRHLREHMLFYLLDEAFIRFRAGEEGTTGNR